MIRYLLLLLLFLVCCRENFVSSDTNPNEFWACEIINIKCNPKTNIQTTTEKCTNAFGDVRFNYYTIECP